MNESSPDHGLGRFLTIADTAEVLNTSVNQVYALVRSGELPAIKIGASGQWRIETAMLEGFIEARYEETRRHNLWTQADFSGVLDFHSSRRDQG